MKRKANKAERDHMGRVAEIGCIVCGMPAEVHHIRTGQGMAQRASNYLTIPLCPPHHRTDDFSTHGADQRAFHNIHGSELDMLAQTIQRLAA